MKKIISLLLLTIFLSGCSLPSSKISADESFRAFTNELFCESVASSTLSLNYTLQNPDTFGIETGNVTFGTFQQDDTAARASLENCQYRLNEFPYNALSRDNQLTYDILSRHLEVSIKDLSFSLYEEPLTPITGLHVQLPILLAEYPLSDETDVQTYLALLETLPEYFHSLIAFEKRKSEAGLFMTTSSADNVITECRDFQKMDNDNYLLSSFADRLDRLPNLSSRAKQTYLTQNKNLVSSAVLPAYENLIAALEMLRSSGKRTDGLCDLPKGKEYYAHLVSRDTGSSRTILELEHLIEKQLYADLMAMQSCSTLPEENLTLSDPTEILIHLTQNLSHAFPDAASVSYEVKYVPESMQAHLSPAFYLIPALDNYKENTIYINPAHNTDNISLFTTLAHEGYPGHLYQTTYFSATNPDPLRHLLSSEGFVEGWATYAEMCSYSLLPIEQSSALFLQRNASFILGLYATADIGIHYYGWKETDTAAYFSSYGITDGAAIKELHHYIVASPGNYLKYYVGYLEILELKKKAITYYGNDFSQKTFHQQLLEIGPAPFEIIEKYLFD